MQLQHAKRVSSAGQYQEARTALQNTLVAAKAMDMPLQRGEALEGIGQEESFLGRDEQARVAYADARARYQAEQNRLGEATVLRGLGDLESQDNPDVARQHLSLCWIVRSDRYESAE